LLRNNIPVAGVIYNPVSQELYCGLKGCNSFKIDIKFGKQSNLKIQNKVKELKDCIVMSHLSSKDEPRKIVLGMLDTIIKASRGIRLLGSGQMALISLAEEQFDIFFNYETNIWDIIPGAVIINGAGGYCINNLTNMREWSCRSKGIIAGSNKSVVTEFADIIREHLPTDEFPIYTANA